MKIFILVLSFLIPASHLYSQLLEENFDYPAGDSIGAHGWNFINGTVNTVLVTSPGLSYSGYSMSGIGNAASLSTTGNDNYKSLSSTVDSGSPGEVYASFMVNVSSAQAAGDYFLAFLPSTSISFYSGRVSARFRSGSLEFGLTKASQPDTNSMLWASGYSLNNTYLLVLKYKFIPGNSNDEVSLFIFSSGIPTTEPAPAIGPQNFSSTSFDAFSIGRVALRQGSSSRAPSVKVDGISVTTAWITDPQTVTVSPNSRGYSKVGNAFSAINSGLHGYSGQVLVLVNGNTTESSPSVLNGNIFSSCLIRPLGARIISGNINNPLIVLDGADNVTIDGLNTGGNSLTITNTNSGMNQGCINLSNGAQNNLIKNLTCNGVGSGGSTGGRTINISQSTDAVGNNNNIIENNLVNGGRRGIQTFGTANLVTNDGTIIRNNIVKNISSIGIFIGSETKDNTVQGNQSYFDVFFTLDVDYRAIVIQGVGTNEVKGNKIHTLSGNSSSGFLGIFSLPVLLTAPGVSTANINIMNNMISITDNNPSSPYIYGIYSASNAVPCTTNVNNNSMLISGTAANINTFSCGIYANNSVAGSITNAINNISSNKREGGDVTSFHIGNLFNSYTNTLISADYNISIATDTVKGYNAGWNNILYTGMNAYRQAACNPNINELHTVFWNAFSFVSNNDLHLIDTTILGGFNGTPVNGVTTDIDGQTRNPVTPYRGADELSDTFQVLNLGIAVQGAVPPGNDVISMKMVRDTPPYDLLGISTEVLYSSFDKNIIDGGNNQIVVMRVGPGFWRICPGFVAGGPPFGIWVWIPDAVYFCPLGNSSYNSIPGYDFTTSASQAFGNNQTMYMGLAAVYNGDVNQDKVIDGSDLAQIDNDASNFVKGNYLANDITRDGIVDGNDLSITDNNANNFISEISPVPQEFTTNNNLLKGFYRANKTIKLNALQPILINGNN